jgi:hypothetical protein
MVAFYLYVTDETPNTPKPDQVGLWNFRATWVAGAVGIEPTTFGFGDRRSAN